MTDADKPAFAAALAELSLLRPSGLKLTKEHYAAWWNTMRHDWTLEEFQRACATLAQNCEDIVIGPQHFARLRKAAEATPAEAWSKVRQALRNFNHHEPTTLGERIDRVVAALGGYRALAMTNTDDMHFREKRFAELWDELGQAEEARVALPSAANQRRVSGPRRVVPEITRQ